MYINKSLVQCRGRNWTSSDRVWPALSFVEFKLRQTGHLFLPHANPSITFRLWLYSSIYWANKLIWAKNRGMRKRSQPFTGVPVVIDLAYSNFQLTVPHDICMEIICGRNVGDWTKWQPYYSFFPCTLRLLSYWCRQIVPSSWVVRNLWITQAVSNKTRHQDHPVPKPNASHTEPLNNHAAVQMPFHPFSSFSWSPVGHATGIAADPSLPN